MSRKSSLHQATSPSQKIAAFGLASATCLGLVGVVALRTAQESQAAEATSDIALAAVTSTSGFTRAQLDAYAAQLAAERQRLEDYRLQLVATAAALNARGTVAAAPANRPKAAAKQRVTKAPARGTTTTPKAPSQPAAPTQPQPAPVTVAPAPKQAPVPQAPAAPPAPAAQAPAPAAPAAPVTQGKTRASKA
ncbi:MAG: hypothetical protein PHU75_08485 [Candidatus Nanopelagicales bacterium]|nr:hypothetical protein [Candidatus Nanopelagicales bacterium]